MVVGVPGSGIGGLFYILLGLLMPAVELVQTFRGRSSLARWRAVGTQAGYSVGIIAALFGMGWLLVAGIGWLDSVISFSPTVGAAQRNSIVSRMLSVSWPWLVWISTLMLLTAIVLPAILAWGLSVHERRRARVK